MTEITMLKLNETKETGVEFMATQDKYNGLIDWIKAILLAIILAFLLKAFIFSTSIVEGVSMDPALEDGQRIIFNKLIYIISEPKRGEVIIIQQPEKNYVKRVIGLPGETIEMANHKLYINNEEQPTSFVDRHSEILTGSFDPIEIPLNQYFVMGDNRAVSKDSRNGLGFIEREHIIGRSELIIYPLDKWGRTNKKN